MIILFVIIFLPVECFIALSLMDEDDITHYWKYIGCVWGVVIYISCIYDTGLWTIADPDTINFSWMEHIINTLWFFPFIMVGCLVASTVAYCTRVVSTPMLNSLTSFANRNR